MVTGMQTMDDLRSVIATLVTGAKAEDTGPKLTAQRFTMMTALDSFDWTSFPPSTHLVNFPLHRSTLNKLEYK